MDNHCPFQVGDQVIYQPTKRGFDLCAMTGQLTPGQIYKVESIEKNAYVVVENHRFSVGGIYWTEFAPKSERE